MRNWKTLVWCLPGSDKASLTITADEGRVAGVSLDQGEVEMTRDACNEALRRMGSAASSRTALRDWMLDSVRFESALRQIAGREDWGGDESAGAFAAQVLVAAEHDRAAGYTTQ